MSRKQHRVHATRRCGISRRDFGRQAALAAAAAAVLPVAVICEPARAEAPAAPLPQQAASQAPKLSPESQAEVDAKIDFIFRRYGTRLAEDQKEDVRRLVTEFQAPLEKLRSFPLENSDGPALVFVPTSMPTAEGPQPRGPKIVRRPKPAVRQKNSS